MFDRLALSKKDEHNVSEYWCESSRTHATSIAGSNTGRRSPPTHPPISERQRHRTCSAHQPLSGAFRTRRRADAFGRIAGATARSFLGRSPLEDQARVSPICRPVVVRGLDDHRALVGGIRRVMTIEGSWRACTSTLN